MTYFVGFICGGIFAMTWIYATLAGLNKIKADLKSEHKRGPIHD